MTQNPLKNVNSKLIDNCHVIFSKWFYFAQIILQNHKITCKNGFIVKFLFYFILNQWLFNKIIVIYEIWLRSYHVGAHGSTSVIIIIILSKKKIRIDLCEITAKNNILAGIFLESFEIKIGILKMVINFFSTKSSILFLLSLKTNMLLIQSSYLENYRKWGV